MPDVPKVVSARLRVAIPMNGHPDPDVLTAFSEQALPQAERTRVMEHLSACTDCREILALALPEVVSPEMETISIAASAEETPIDVADRRSSRSGWLTWPRLRWGFAIAGVVIIGAVGLRQYRKPAGVQSLAQRAVSEPVLAGKTAADAVQNDSTKQEEAKLNFAETRRSRASEAAESKAQATAPLDSHNQFHGLAFSRDAVSKDKSAAFAAQSVPPPPPPASAGSAFQTHRAVAGASPLVVRSAGGAAPLGPTTAAAGRNISGNIGGPIHSDIFIFPKTTSAGDSTQVVEAQSRAVPAVTVPSPEKEKAQSVTAEAAATSVSVQYSETNGVPNAKPVSALGALVSSQPQIVELKAAVPIWSISATGALQRSFDAGKTWNAVNVFAAPAAADSATAAEDSATVEQFSTRSAKKTNNLRKAIGSPVFRAVTTNGAEVWAGGEKGVLYHSIDSGDHWTRVSPTSDGVALIDDIVRLEFPAPQNLPATGRVTTSTAQVWTTADDGQTWRKQ